MLFYMRVFIVYLEPIVTIVVLTYKKFKLQVVFNWFFATQI